MKDERYNTELGIYTKNCGIENVLPGGAISEGLRGSGICMLVVRKPIDSPSSAV